MPTFYFKMFISTKAGIEALIKERTDNMDGETDKRVTGIALPFLLSAKLKMPLSKTWFEQFTVSHCNSLLRPKTNQLL